MDCIKAESLYCRVLLYGDHREGCLFVFGYHGSKLEIRTCVEGNRYVWWDDFIFIMFHIYTPALPLPFV